LEWGCALKLVKQEMPHAFVIAALVAAIHAVNMTG
jgi:hypothetical protein